MVDQVEFHPRLQQPSLQAFLTEHDIVLEAWAPLVMRGAVNEIPETRRDRGSARHVYLAQVSIRWILQMGYVAWIPKSVHDARIAENADVFDFELTDDEMEVIDSLRSGPPDRSGPGHLRLVSGLSSPPKSSVPKPNHRENGRGPEGRPLLRVVCRRSTTSRPMRLVCFDQQLEERLGVVARRASSGASGPRARSRSCGTSRSTTPSFLKTL